MTNGSSSWMDTFSEMAEELPSDLRGVDFGPIYQATFDVDTAMEDLRVANTLGDAPESLAYSVYTPTDPDDAAELRFTVFARRPMLLSQAMPHLTKLGVNIMDERPFEWTLRDKDVYVYDFGFKLAEGETPDDWSEADRQRFCDAFTASYQGKSEADQLNKLVLAAKLDWRQVTWLRGLSRYLRQAGISYSQDYVAAALNNNASIAQALVEAFQIRFNPTRDYADLEARTAAFDAQIKSIEAMLNDVDSLDEDRILRMFVSLMKAIVRTNAFADDRPALAFKLLPQQLDMLPAPRPAYEIFVYSPRVQGVHLRFGDVARGGLRWSDRAEDFRTEVLGLVKAQMVKNTVIVPVGAKGGFVPQHLPDPRVDRNAWMNEGIACYQIFVSSLLSVTDNLVDGAIVPPVDVVRHDDDDYYLVVAADKGTASFSDIANKISTDRGFWLGDAFASGGSAGYDHKGMGITARGAWESVKRHFYEIGVDCQNEDFTCVGIGDMAGDVFGNGMLRSKHTRLVAAFNHMHIFIDPNPDAAISFEERKRLFETPRSTWADYNPELISAGGGVWERGAKSVPLSPEAREVLGIEADVDSMTPAELISAILKAPVDLLFNGGIGTYVKASTETHQQVGDKANDSVRVNGGEVRATISGEGGNLGWTQLGRVEYARSGGRGNTDFIDNSAGVDTSDHEVNIKILLSGQVKAGKLDMDERNELLASMTDDIAAHVLQHNIDHSLALSAAEAEAAEMVAAHEAWMQALEASGDLNRALEGLPSAKAMAQLINDGGQLTRPDLCSLMSNTKIKLEELILATDLADDPILADRLYVYFPKALRERYADAIAEHPLRREIITMMTVNQFVNSMGITAYHQLASDTGAEITAIVRAQMAARGILQIDKAEALLAEAKVDATTQTAMRIKFQRLVEAATRWLLNNRRSAANVADVIEEMSADVEAVHDHLEALLTPHQRDISDALLQEFSVDGVAPELAKLASEAPFAHLALPIVDVAHRSGRGLELVARTYFAVADQVDLDLVATQIAKLPRTSHWDTQARAAMRDDLAQLRSDLTVRALAEKADATDVDAVMAAWIGQIEGYAQLRAVMTEITSGPANLAQLSVGLRMLRSLLS